MSTTRAQVLEFAKTFPAALGEWVGLASAGFSAKGIAAKAQEIQKTLTDTEARIKRLPYLSHGTFMAVTGALASLAVIAAAIAPEVGAYCGWCSAVLLVATGALFFIQGRGAVLRDETTELKRRLTKFAPIAGTDLCRSALQYVQSAHPEVLAWRDMAIADRGQLYAFDVEIMGHLYHVAEQGRAAGEQKRLNDEACRMVYGITPAIG